MKKRIVGILLALVLVSTAAVSFATSVPSKTTDDMTTVVSVTTASGNTVTISTTDEASKLAADKFVNSLSNGGLQMNLGGGATNPMYSDIIKVLDPSYKNGMPSVRPVVSEVIPVKFEGYQAGDGDVAASFVFATPYEDGQNIAALVAIDKGTPVMDYYLLAAEVVDGVVIVHFTAEVIELMANHTSFMAIVSGENR